MNANRSTTLAPFLCGLAAAAVITAGVALLLYTGQGFLKTAGILLFVASGALTAGLWAGDDSSASTRPRLIVFIVILIVSCAFAAKWTASESFRDTTFAGSLAVLFLLALPGYGAGSALASMQRHERSDTLAVHVLAGAAIGFILTTTLLVPRIDAWGVYFAAAALLAPSVLIPATGGASTKDKGGMMRDRVVIVTGVGAAGQLGFAVARAFAEAGARIVAAGHSDDIRGLAVQLGPRERVIGVRADLTTTAGAAAVADAARAFGRLDALVNIAGGLTVIQSIEDTTDELFRREMGINAETVLNMSRAALPMLRESKGAIVNFASPAGSNAIAKLGAYSAAKAAVIAITRSLALEELANGVRVNAISPGMIDTDQNRASASAGQKYVSREEVANVVMFLAGPDSTGITGQTIQVPGATLS